MVGFARTHDAPGRDTAKTRNDMDTDNPKFFTSPFFAYERKLEPGLLHRTLSIENQLNTVPVHTIGYRSKVSDK